MQPIYGVPLPDRQQGIPALKLKAAPTRLRPSNPDMLFYGCCPKRLCQNPSRQGNEMELESVRMSKKTNTWNVYLHIQSQKVMASFDASSTCPSFQSVKDTGREAFRKLREPRKLLRVRQNRQKILAAPPPHPFYLFRLALVSYVLAFVVDVFQSVHFARQTTMR